MAHPWPGQASQHLQAMQEKKALCSRGCGVSGVSTSCGAPRGFLPRHDEDLRKPLVRRQGSQVSMRVARGSAWSPLSGLKGVQPPLPFGERTRDCSPGHAGKEGPQLARVLALESWEGTRASRRVEEGLSRSENQVSSCVEEWNSTCLPSCSRGDRPLVELCL